MATNNEKKIYVAVGVLALLGGALGLLAKNANEDAKAHSAAGAAALLPDVKLADDAADKLDKIEIKNGAKGSVTLEKQGAEWKVVKPASYAANQQNVKSLIDNLKTLKLKESIDPSAAAYATYECDDEKSVHVVASKGAEKAIDLYFGKSGGRGQMVRVGGKDGVFAASGYSSYLYAREVKDWRDKEVFKFEDGNAISVSIKNEAGELSFSKNEDKWSGTFGGAPIDGFDPEKVKDMLRALKALTAEDFGDDKSAADTGLDKPVATVVVKLKDDAGTYELQVGKTSTGSSHFAKKKGSDTVYVIGSWSADWATAAASKFQKTDPSKDAGAKPEAGEAKKDKKKK